MGVHIGADNRAAVLSLILCRIVYAINWFNLAAVFSFAASDLNQNVSGLGLVTAMFYLGIGIFQLPGGILAAKIGPRLTAIYGTTVASLAALLSSFASNLVEIAALRFFVGFGMAFVFAPGVILMTRFLKKGSEGLGVGLYNLAFNLGGAIGLSGWAVLAVTAGWRNALITSGSLGLFTSVLLWLLVPKDTRRPNFKLSLQHLKHILLDKWLIALSIALLGLEAGTAIYNNFTPYYLESVIHLNAGEAGTIASVASLFALATSPLAGRLFDKFGNAKQLLFATGVLMTIGVGIAFIGTVHSSILSGILVGLASGAGFTIGFSASRAANRLDKEYETLAVSWVNSISLFGVFVPPLLYSYLVTQYGYSPAWLYLAILTFALTIPILIPKHQPKQTHGKSPFEPQESGLNTQIQGPQP